MSTVAPERVPGKVYAEEAYAHAKMLDHSGWQNKEEFNEILPRLSTGGDVDFFFDADGKVMFCELSRSHTEWWQVSTGQWLAYRNFIKNSPHCSVLCKHEVVPEIGRFIDTRKDILEFQILVYDPNFVTWPMLRGFIPSPVLRGNDRWQQFVLNWFKPGGTEEIRRWVIRKGVELVRPGVRHD
jgi:hypothetical protein